MPEDTEPGLMQSIAVPIEMDTAVPAKRRWRQPRERVSIVSLTSYSLIKKGVSRYDWADPYRFAVELSWPRFVLTLVGVYVSVTSLFAACYTLVPGAVANARPHVFLDNFFFSLETLATVGYGYMYPASIYGHLIASAEILTGLAFTAMLTGLIFFRFSKPRPKFLFAKHPVVTMHNGKPTLMLRIGNGRAAVFADAKVKVSILISEVSVEGARFRRTHELRLARNSIPVFPLTWTVMHEIDEHSPLTGLDRETFVASDVRLFVSFEARDPTLALVVHDLRDYAPDAVLFGVRYADVISQDANGNTWADMTRLDEVVEGGARD